MRRAWAALAAMLLLAAAPAPPPAAPATLYRHLRLIDGTGAPARDDMAIVVRGERIVAVVPDARRPALGPGDRAVDLAGRTVIPGLVDSHVHMATPPDLPRARAMLRRDLYGGVTLVRDMADDLRPVAELARETARGEAEGPDIAFAALMAGTPFFADPRVAAASRGWPAGTAPWMQAITRATDLRLAIARAKGTGAAAIKIYADLPPDLVRAIVAGAHAQGMRAWAHSAVFPTRPADVIAAGPDTISHVCYLAYQREPVMLASYEDHTPVHEALLQAPADPVMARLFAEMRRRGMILDATGSLFVRAEAERAADPARRPLRCTGALTTRLARQAWAAGVPLTTGTDHVAGADGQWPEMHDELFWLVRGVGLPPLAALTAATLNGARAAGRGAEQGSVQPGKLADFVVLTRDPLADIANVRAIDFTVMRGRIYRRREYRPVTPAEMPPE